MKVGGIEVTKSEEVLVLPRPNGPDIVFHARAVESTDEFDHMVPEPKPKAHLVAGGWKKNLDDPNYLREREHYGQLRFAWMLIKTLAPSDIEWDTVNMEKPSTWENWEKDLKADGEGLCQNEVNLVINCVSAANALNESKLEAAREHFLQGLATASKRSTGQSTDPETTQSGEPASE